MERIYSFLILDFPLIRNRGPNPYISSNALNHIYAKIPGSVYNCADASYIFLKDILLFYAMLCFIFMYKIFCLCSSSGKIFYGPIVCKWLPHCM